MNKFNTIIAELLKPKSFPYIIYFGVPYNLLDLATFITIPPENPLPFGWRGEWRHIF